MFQMSEIYLDALIELQIVTFRELFALVLLIYISEDICPIVVLKSILIFNLKGCCNIFSRCDLKYISGNGRCYVVYD